MHVTKKFPERARQMLRPRFQAGVVPVRAATKTNPSQEASLEFIQGK